MKPEQEIGAVFQLLKIHFKAKRLTYRELAPRLHMSESNLKRIFSTRSCGFEQIAQICAAAEISFFEIVTAAAKTQVLNYHLTLEAEEFFLNNFECFVFYRNLASFRNPSEFLKSARYPRAKADAYLEALEKLKLIKRARQSIEILNSGYLKFSDESKLQRKLKDKWVPWFFDRVLRNEGGDNYFLRFQSTGLTNAHRSQLVAEMEQLFDRYRQIGFADQQIGSTDYTSVGMCVGMGPHRVGFFETPGFELPR